MDFVERAVLRLREQPGFSRNRHFQALSSPEGRRALRIHRHLCSLERALAGGGPVAVEREGDRVRLTLGGRGFRRVAFLAAREFRWLCRSPAVRAALAAGGGPAAPHDPLPGDGEGGPEAAP
jgi:hypothetical protein